MTKMAFSLSGALLLSSTLFLNGLNLAAFAKGEVLNDAAAQLSAHPVGAVNAVNPPVAGQLAPSQPMHYPPGISDGAGIWVNLWNYPTKDFEQYAENLYASGVRNLWIQTSRSNTPAISQPNELGQIIEACHKYKIRVIAWSFAELHNTKADAEKLIFAARFRSANGDRLDGIAPNLEKNLHKEAVESYSKHLREALGDGYPMVAVVYSPLNRAPAVAITPWKTLDKYYQVIAPMAYWNGRYQTIDAYTYTKRTVERIRELTGRSDVEVHVIGDGMGTHAPEIKEFLRACADAGAQSASLYPNQRTTTEQFTAMSRYDDFMPLNSRERLTLVRDLMSKGLIGQGGRFDPAKPMSRGDLFRLTANALNVRGGEDSGSAFAYFQRLGVIDNVARRYPEIAMAEEMSSPVSFDTAGAFVSAAKQAVASQKHGGKAPRRQENQYMTMSRPSRADRLFVAPAYAAQESLKAPQAKGDRHMSYFDAAQLLHELKTKN